MRGEGRLFSTSLTFRACTNLIVSKVFRPDTPDWVTLYFKTWTRPVAGTPPGSERDSILFELEVYFGKGTPGLTAHLNDSGRSERTEQLGRERSTHCTALVVLIFILFSGIVIAPQKLTEQSPHFAWGL